MSRHLRQVGAFLLVGGTTAALYYLLIYVFYGLLEAYYLTAVSIAYAGAVIFHFMANRNVTFGGSNGNTKRQIVKYVLLAGLNYVITLTVVAISVNYLVLSIYLATALAILATLVTGFLGMKHWVFSGPRESCVKIPPAGQ